jgi:hypothetical protein
MNAPEDIKNGTIHDTNQYGKIIVVEYRKYNDITVEFLDTGFRKICTTNNIRNGQVADDSAMPADIKPGTIMRSKNFGKFVIVGKSKAKKTYATVQFEETGTLASFRYDDIRNGSVMDRNKKTVFGVGFIGYGEYSTRDIKAYKCWNRMLERCYSERWHKSKPTYIGCKVCEDWHNYQVFAKWYFENHPQDGGDYHLDKDLGCYGMNGKIYSPETCIFVPPEINAEESHAKSYRFKKEGKTYDIYNMSKFCERNGLSKSNMAAVNTGRIHSYKGWTRAG